MEFEIIPEPGKKRNGGNRNRDKTVDNNVYTPKSTADQITEYLHPHFTGYRQPFILDACAGDGVLGRSILNKTGGSLRMVDSSPSGPMVNKGNVLQESRFRKPDIIICNPPWPEKTAKEIWHSLYNHLSENGILIFLINNVFCYQGYERVVALEFQKYYFLPRYAFKDSGRPLLDCGIMITHKNGVVPFPAASLKPFIPIPRK